MILGDAGVNNTADTEAKGIKKSKVKREGFLKTTNPSYRESCYSFEYKISY
jgi:hypothetical protein